MVERLWPGATRELVCEAVDEVRAKCRQLAGVPFDRLLIIHEMTADNEPDI